MFFSVRVCWASEKEDWFTAVNEHEYCEDVR